MIDDRKAGDRAQCRDVAVPETPTVICPECGTHDLCHVKWGYVPFPRRGKIVIGAAIFGGAKRPEGAPDWACLHCHPEWVDIHLLAIKEEECQQNMEEFVARGEFDPACHWREQRDKVRQ